MNLLTRLFAPKPAPVRYVVATKRDNRRLAQKYAETHAKLRQELDAKAVRG